ncbi:MAG: hypothetical protein ACP5M3_08030 [Acidithiobacillus sp.]
MRVSQTLHQQAVVPVDIAIETLRTWRGGSCQGDVAGRLGQSTVLHFLSIAVGEQIRRCRRQDAGTQNPGEERPGQAATQ